MSSKLQAQHSRIKCDCDYCTWSVVITQDIDDNQAFQIVEILGGSVKSGSHRDYHHCAEHKEEKAKEEA